MPDWGRVRLEYIKLNYSDESLKKMSKQLTVPKWWRKELLEELERRGVVNE